MSVISGTVLRTRGDSFSLRLDRRAFLTGLVLALIALTIAVYQLVTGDVPVPLRDVVASLLGRADAGTDFVIRELRLPRVAAALLVGAALGIAGAIFQSVTRNPLGSPDFVGLTSGSSTGALIVILVIGGSGMQIAFGALAGCLLTSALVYVLSFRGGTNGVRLILMGIGVSAMLEAFNSFLVLRARLDEAIAAQVWIIGSLNGREWQNIAPLALVLVVCLPLTLWLSRSLTMLTMGDDTAALQGVHVERDRLLLLGSSVLLTAFATACAGPVAFVALAAPQLALRLTRSSGPNILPAAAMGALLLIAADSVAQHGTTGNTPLPVGVATGALGGVYLTWLLVHEWRKGRA